MIREALLTTLRRDPYFEARAAAAQALGVLYGADAQIEHELTEALADTSALVVVQAIRALGTTGTSRSLLARLQAFYLAGHWPYRLEVVETLIKLLQRGVLQREDLEGHLDRILATSAFFMPEFPLNEKLRRLAELLDGPCRTEG